MMTQASDIAVEHMLWCADRGISPVEVLASIGERWEWRGLDPAASYVAERLALSWERVTAGNKALLRVVA